MNIANCFRSHKKTSIAVSVVLLLLVGAVGVAWAYKIAPLSWGLWGEVNATDGVAIDGYDPVAYFVSGEARKGSPEYTYRWKDVNWHFASEENRKAFEQDPDKYAPQHGGYCTVAAEEGFTAASDPTAWAIRDKKLYLFVGADPKQSWTKK